MSPQAMPPSCARWAQLTDAKAVGELLTQDEESFVVSHAASCSACATEANLWSELNTLLEPSEVRTPSLAPPARHEAPQGPVAATPEPHGAVMDGTGTSRTSKPRRRLVQGLVAGLALAAAFAVLHRMAPKSQEAQDTAAITQTAMGSATSAVASHAPLSPAIPAEETRTTEVTLTRSGEVEVNGRPRSAGTPLVEGELLFARSGAACLRVEPGAHVCVVPGSLLRVQRARENERRLELLAGKLAVSLEPQPPGTSFGVVTRDGNAIAVGTAYTVEVPPGSGAIVTRVVHGTVRVEDHQGHATHVTAHQKMALGASLEAMAPEEEKPESAFVQTTWNPSTPSQEERRPRATGTAGFAQAPTSSPRSTHRTSKDLGTPANAASESPSASSVESRSTAVEPRTEPSITSPSLSTATPPSTPMEVPSGPPAVQGPVPTQGAHGEASANPSPAQLLLAARQARSTGRTRDALATYDQLFSLHGSSAEARAARVPYGELLLASPGKESLALSSFERYLREGGPLVEEAHYGRIRTLRSLGRTAEEKKFILEFLAMFPQSPLASGLRTRLTALGGPP